MSRRRRKRRRTAKPRSTWTVKKKMVKQAIMGIAETRRYRNPFVTDLLTKKILYINGPLQDIEQGDQDYQREGSSIFLRGIKLHLQVWPRTDHSLGINCTGIEYNCVLLALWLPENISTQSVGSPVWTSITDPQIVLPQGATALANTDERVLLGPYECKNIKVVWKKRFKVAPYPLATILDGETSYAPARVKYITKYLKFGRKIQFLDHGNAVSAFTKWKNLYFAVYYDTVQDSFGPGPDVNFALDTTVYWKDF